MSLRQPATQDADVAHETLHEDVVGQALREEVVREALREVIDPELGLDVVELGMIRNVEFEGDTTVVFMVLTTMTCPFWSLFVDQVNTALGPVPSVTAVDVRLEPGGRWSPDMLSESARWELEAQGLLHTNTLFA